MANLSDDDKCRFCKTEVESVSHLISGCQTLLGDGHYTHRHNQVCRYIHWRICKAIGMETKPIQDHEPARSTAHGDYIIYYDKPIPLGRFVEGGGIKPDIVLWDRHTKSAQIIEVSVPNDYGLNRDRETERQRDRETERQRDRETERQRDRETERRRDRDRETERQRDGETERQRQ